MRGTDKKAAGANFLILVEGEVTEPAYFKKVLETLKLSAAQVRVFPHGTGSKPAQLVDAALAKKTELEKPVTTKDGLLTRLAFDRTWVVFDTDAANRDGHLKPGIDHAEANGVTVAHTTPCFEFWLALHLSNAAPQLRDGSAAASHLNRVLREKGTRLDYAKDAGVAEKLMPHLMPHLATAVKNAQALAKDQAATGATNPGTTVHPLLIALNNAAPAGSRPLDKAESTRRPLLRGRPRR